MYVKMYLFLENLELSNFKNYNNIKLNFSKGINFITGPNASGKTNILDAIYLLSFTKSYFIIHDSQLINNESKSDFYFVKGLYKNKDSIEELQITYNKTSGKKIKRNGKEYEKFINHIGLIPLIMITPNDTILISEGSEVRRRFLDKLISQIDKEYLHHIIQYKKALKHRNNLLKQTYNLSSLISIFEPWDRKLEEHGNYIYKKRNQITELLTYYFNEFYYKIADDNYKVEVKYKSQLGENTISNLLVQSFETDKALQYTTKGVHKDDLIFTINGLKLKKIASQGQQKTLLLALKLAEKKIIENFSSKNPLLLFDDIFDKLDETRVTNMLNTLVENNKNQIFITDTHTQRMLNIKNRIKINSKLLEISKNRKINVYE